MYFYCRSPIMEQRKNGYKNGQLIFGFQKDYLLNTFWGL